MHPNDGRVVSNFIVQALKGDDITLYGDGLQTRSFCYVDDLIDAIIGFMDLSNDPSGNSVFHGPINLGNPAEFTILELAKKVLSHTGSKSRLMFHPLPVDDPMQRQPDISLAKQYLDWKPKVQLDEGLIKTIEYFDQILSSDNLID